MIPQSLTPYATYRMVIFVCGPHGCRSTVLHGVFRESHLDPFCVLCCVFIIHSNEPHHRALFLAADLLYILTDYNVL